MITENAGPGDARAGESRIVHVEAAHNVLAIFDDLATATRAMLHLERAGVAAASIALLGARPEHTGTEAVLATTELTQHDDADASAGAVDDGAIGALTTLIVPGIGPALAAGIWTVGGAASGGIGGVAGIGGSDAWRETYLAVETGRAVVGVHTDDADQADLGEHALSTLGPVSLRRFDA